jgi:hypothetical protein
MPIKMDWANMAGANSPLNMMGTAGIDVAGGSAQAAAGASAGSAMGMLSKANPYIQMVQGGYEMYKDISGRINSAKDWTAGIPDAQKDSRGRPTYNLGESRGKLSALDTSSFNDGAIAGNALTGAAIGSVVPGVGTAVGAGVGALVGGVAGFLGGEKANSEAGKTLSAEEQLFAKQQDQFNASNTLYDANEDARASVQARSRERQRRATIVG